MAEKIDKAEKVTAGTNDALFPLIKEIAEKYDEIAKKTGVKEYKPSVDATRSIHITALIPVAAMIEAGAELQVGVFKEGYLPVPTKLTPAGGDKIMAIKTGSPMLDLLYPIEHGPWFVKEFVEADEVKGLCKKEDGRYVYNLVDIGRSLIGKYSKVNIKLDRDESTLLEDTDATLAAHERFLLYQNSKGRMEK